MPQDQRWLADLIAVVVAAPGLLLILTGTVRGLRAIKATGRALAEDTPAVQRARHLFIAGWVVLALGLSVGMAYVGAHFPD